jgi:hypothetical protein
MINELANKVPTLLQYDENTNVVKAWGFLCDQEREDVDVIGYFKLHLDPAYQDPRPDAPKLEQARQWFRDYLRCIHDHIEETFSNSFPRWKSQKTEFVFSVPTTWKNPSMIAETEKLVRDAGFGHDGPNHRAEIGLTEAEAAAVYASKQHFDVSSAQPYVHLRRSRLLTPSQKDDVILVCDAGGGTTVSRCCSQRQPFAVLTKRCADRT